MLASDSSRLATLYFAVLAGEMVISTQDVAPDNHPAPGDPTVLPVDWTQVHSYAIHFVRCGSVRVDVDGATAFTIPYADLVANSLPLTFAFLSGTCTSAWSSAHYDVCEAGNPSSSTSNATASSSGASSSGASSAASSSSGGGGAPSSSGAHVVAPGGRGCGCGVASSSASTWWVGLGLLAALEALRRARERSHSR